MILQKESKHLTLDEVREILLQFNMQNILENITLNGEVYVLTKSKDKISNCRSIDMLYAMTFTALGNTEVAESFTTPDWTFFSIKGDAITNAIFSKYLSSMYNVSI